MAMRLGVPLEVKALHAREFEGHAAVFRNVDQGGDIVMPGAFRRSLTDHTRAGTWPPMFWMHDPAAVPGVWKAMEEDATGLRVIGELIDTQLGNEVHELLTKQAVRGLSIGYRVPPGGSDVDRDGHRLLKEINLVEASIVTLAMNPLARVEGVKARLSSAGEYVPTVREFEASLRQAGYSKSVARTLVARVYDDASETIEEAAARELLEAIKRNTTTIRQAAAGLGGYRR